MRKYLKITNLFPFTTCSCNLQYPYIQCRGKYSLRNLLQSGEPNMPNTRLVPPDFWSSTRSGLDTDAIQDGLIEQYAHNKSLKRAVPIRKGAVQEDGGP